MTLPFVSPAGLDPSFTISRPTVADIDALSEVYFQSFATDPGNTYWWSPDREAMRDWLRDRIERKMANRSVRHYHVVDNKAKDIVAFARWDIPKGFDAQFGEWVDSNSALGVSHVAAENNTEEPTATTPTTAPVEETEPTVASTMAGPRGSDQELCRCFFSALSSLSKKWNAEEMLGLSLLCTSPKYHRRGAAKALLTPMLAVADTAGLQCYLEATPGGRPVYEKLGFRTVEVKEFDIGALTSGRMKGLYKLSIMIREPQKL
ncbi:acyl-CoA N-acyltransferase [Xylaria bambusicola]|uniref:acyl-CoA N-acyltransferase n=1 Tax=Xylaria bambusicola TaxID=326684 RepID=UPI00200749E2|nr:acyl-CoA N-acyltransferase [Xylaria bambusicola]KAI0514597.1 acyl-CoA N-acyltransferase [Xylaria bambusicola]